MRLALQTLFCNQSSSGVDSNERARFETDARKSQVSSKFLNKIRQVISSPLTSAPEVFADESFPDANIVAEYIDCQLDSSEIANEYERVCSENPVILAEVADCYDVLNNYLPRPTTAPKNCRRRLYYIAWEEELPPSDSATKKRDSKQSESLPKSFTGVEDAKIVDATLCRDKETAPCARLDSVRRDRSLKSGVQSGIKEQNIWRKRFRLGFKGCLTFLIVVGGFNMITKLRESRETQTFEIRPSVAQTESSSRETRIDEPSLPTDDPDSITVNEELASNGSDLDAFEISSERDPVKVASLSPELSEAKVSVSGYEPSGGDVAGGGLGSALERNNGNLEIPDANYDAFSGLKPY